LEKPTHDDTTCIGLVGGGAHWGGVLQGRQLGEDRFEQDSVSRRGSLTHG